MNFKHFNKKNLIILGISMFLVSATWTFAQTAQELLTQPVDITSVSDLVDAVEGKYKNLQKQDARQDAATLLLTFKTFCQNLQIDCTAEINNVDLGIRGATKDALVRIIKSNWDAIKKKITKKSASKTAKQLLKNTVIEQATPKLIDYAGTKLPENLVNLYKGSELKQTVKDTAENLGKMIIAGSVTETQVETALRDVFGTATVDTANFATGLIEKYNLKNVATIILKDPKNTKAIKEAVGQEIKNYADQEINKLANQAVGTIFPVLQGVQIDFTNLNSKTLKATLRSTIVNAMAQSYLGPQYVAVYLAVSTACPPCMEKTQAELRRFDKNYIQPATEKIGDEWGRFEDRVKAESERVGKQIAAEWKRLSERVSAELNRQKEQVTAEANRAKERFQAELKRAQDSKIGKEIERQLNDISDEAGRTADKAEAELKRELDDVLKESERLGKRAGEELSRQISDAKAEIKRFGNSTKNELKREVKDVSGAAQKAKDKIEAELKRAAEKAKEEAQRAANRVKAEANRFKKKLKKKLRF